MTFLSAKRCVNGKNTHSLRGINHKNQIAFTTKSAQYNEILSKAG